MRKLYKLFVAAALLFASTAAWAQEDELIVANGTTTSSYIPVYGLWIDAAQHNQVLYPADSLEDMVGGTISGITFYLSSQNSNAWGTTVTLKLGTTDASTLSGLNTSTSLTQVWQGPWNGQAAEISVTFDEEFVYEGDNLLLDIQTTAATYSSAYFYGVSLTGASHYTYNSSGSTQNFLPKTKFEYTPGSGDICRKPKFMTFSDYTNNGATISWTEPVDGGTLYVIFIDGVEVGTTTDTFYTASGLSANEDHYVVVKNVCSEGDSSGSLNGVFHTLCQEGNCQVQVIATSSYTYSTTYNPHAKVYQNGSLIADVNTNAVVDICNGDSLIVLYQASTSTSYESHVQIIDAGGTDLFNAGTNSYSTGDTLVALANGCPSCIPPLTVAKTGSSAFSTTIHWTDQNGIGDYAIYVNGVLVDIVSSDTAYLLSTYPLTSYVVGVARVCDEDDTSASRTITFTTPCDETVYAPLPFSSGFEELDPTGDHHTDPLLPECWLKVATGTNTTLSNPPEFPMAYRHAPNAHNSNVYFEFESNLNETEILALPRMENVSNLQLSFYASSTNGTYKCVIEAGVIEIDDEGEFVFVPVDTINLELGSGGFSSNYHVYNVYFDSYEGDGERLAIRTTPTGEGTYTIFFDDFTVLYAGEPVLGPFAENYYDLAVGDTLHLAANLMAGEVETWTWSSPMISAGQATIVSQDSNEVTIVYNASGIDSLTVTASNSAGSATRTVAVTVVDLAPVSEFPYENGFELGEDLSWHTANQANGWFVGNAVSYEGSQSLYISRDNGATNMMTGDLNCYSYAYRAFDLPDSTEYALSFMWKANGTAGSRYMRVYIADGEVNPSAGSSPSSSWTQLGNDLANASTWTDFSHVFFAGPGVHTLIFYWYGTGNQNPPHAVDNINLAVVTCPTPRDLTVENAEFDNVTLSWTSIGEESAWQIKVDTNEWIDVTENPYTLMGLTANTSYTARLRAVCGDGDTSLPTGTISFRTACEGESCQVRVSYTTTSTSYRGNYELIQSGSSYGTTNADRTYNVCSGIPLYVRTSTPSYTSTSYYFNLIDAADIELLHIRIDSLTNDTLYIGNPCPTCLPAVNIHVDSTTADGGTISWSAMGNNTDWLIYVNGEQVGGIVSDTVYTFTGLTDNTEYTVGIRAYCEEGDTSVMRTKTMRTACAGGNCEFTLVMTDSYGDGWNGNAINVYQNGSLFGSYTISSGSSNTVTVSPCLGTPIDLIWHSGNYVYETSFVIKDAEDSVLLTISNATGSATACSEGDTLVSFDGLCEATVVFQPGTDPGTDCAAPTGLTVTATDSTVTVSFTGVSGYIEGYEAEIQEGTTWAGGMGEEEDVTGTTHTFTGLTPGTDYVIGVRTVCDSWYGEYSSWVTITVTTTSSEPMECYAPTGLSTVNVDSNRATITWTPGGEEEQWQIKVNSDTNYILASSSTYTLNNLTPSTTYHIRVRSYCGADNQSGWSAELTFTTAASGNDGIEVADGMQASLYPNPATSKLTVEAAEMVEVSIIDLNGREVYRSDMAATEHRIDVSGLAKGAYFVRLTGNNNTAVRKLIVK